MSQANESFPLFGNHPFHIFWPSRQNISMPVRIHLSLNISSGSSVLPYLKLYLKEPCIFERSIVQPNTC